MEGETGSSTCASSRAGDLGGRAKGLQEGDPDRGGGERRHSTEMRSDDETRHGGSGSWIKGGEGEPKRW